MDVCERNTSYDGQQVHSFFVTSSSLPHVGLAEGWATRQRMEIRETLLHFTAPNWGLQPTPVGHLLQVTEITERCNAARTSLT